MTKRFAGYRLFPSLVCSLGALILSSAPLHAALIFSEDFSGAVPGGYYSGGSIPGTAFSITSGNVDIVGVLNGSFFTCDANPGGTVWIWLVQFGAVLPPQRIST